MVFAPLTSDAPLYHWPRATVGLIAANVVAFAAVRSGLGGGEEVVLTQVGLVLGNGLHPLQWVTSNFVHLSFLHLAGNMMFLWAFGLIVEGKLGWRRFLAVYFTAGVLECAAEQVCLLSLRPPAVSFGASAVIFGLMAMALLWAPRNDLVLGYWLPGLGVGTVDVSIVVFSLLFVAGQGVLAWLAGLTLTSQVLHLLGAGIGFAIGTVMWYRGAVDCEGWDLYSVLQGRHLRAASDMYISSLKDTAEMSVDTEPVRRKRKKSGDTKRGATRRKARCINRVRSLLDHQRPLDALGELRDAQHVLPDWRLPPHDHLRLAEALEREECWNEAVLLWEDYLHGHPDAPDDLRLRAAMIMLDRQRRPQAALNTIAPLSTDSLTKQDRARHADISGRATAMLTAGVIEVNVRGS